MGLYAPAENTPVILPGFHHHSKIGKLRRPLVDVQTVEIILQNALSSIALSVPLRFINLHQHIKGIDQNMATAHAGVYLHVVFDTIYIPPNMYTMSRKKA